MSSSLPIAPRITPPSVTANAACRRPRAVPLSCRGIHFRINSTDLLQEFTAGIIMYLDPGHSLALFLFRKHAEREHRVFSVDAAPVRGRTADAAADHPHLRARHQREPDGLGILELAVFQREV